MLSRVACWSGTIALLGLLVGALTIEGAPANGTQRGACPPHGSVRVLSSPSAALYYPARTRVQRTEKRLFGCRRPSGRGVYIADVYDPIWFPAAVDLSGTRAVVGTWVLEARDTFVVGVWNLDKRDYDRFARSEEGKFAAVRVNRRGAVAWVMCQNDYEGLDDRRRGRECGRGGRAVKVVYKSADATEKEGIPLDEGRGIDPDSLRIRRSTIAWTHNGLRKLAPIN